MRIMMMTNTYLPHVGGVARSVAAFTRAYRDAGHEVLVVAPTFEGVEEDEQGIVRVPAIQNFNGSDFSVIVPNDGLLERALQDFEPEIIHSHHPFLMGGAAQRIAAIHDLPLVFTHHTLYEQYTHYAPGDSAFLKRFVAELSTEYANLAQHVIAPSESIRDLLLQRGVTTPVSVVPTGLDPQFFDSGCGRSFRKVMGIPADAYVIGHVGRLAPEKNLDFLTRAICPVLKRNPGARFLLVGAGPALDDIRRTCKREGVLEQLITTGPLQQPILTSAYRAMDVFAFASQSETQGMVLTEAMATRTPVVAVDASGVREVLRDGYNGRMLASESLESFSAALGEMQALEPKRRAAYRRAALSTARKYTIARCADLALQHYRDAIDSLQSPDQGSSETWDSLVKRISAEWNSFGNLASAAGRALIGGDEEAA